MVDLIVLTAKMSFYGNTEYSLSENFGNQAAGLTLSVRSYGKRFGNDELWETSVAVEELEERLRRLEAIAIVPDEPILGLDGTTYELLIRKGQTQVIYRWWQELPMAWRSLQPLVDWLQRCGSDRHERRDKDRVN